jgi:hypothetical protein
MMYPRRALPSATMAQSPKSSSRRALPPRFRESGVGKIGGMTIAAITAAIVFFVGRPFLPPPDPSTSEPAGTGTDTRSPAAANPSALPPDAASIEATKPVDASVLDTGTALAHAGADGKNIDGSTIAAADAAATPSAARAEATLAADAAAGNGDDDSADRSAKTRGPAAESQADKDLAREAWRANRPDIRVSGTQASILIPIKGSIDGGTYKVLSRIHTVVITLPRAASLNTQHFYRLNKHGFQVLWTDQAETNARAKDGTKLRLVLGVPGTPQVELRDDFVRVTIPRPEAARTVTPEDAEIPDEEN